MAGKGSPERVQNEEYHLIDLQGAAGAGHAWLARLPSYSLEWCRRDRQAQLETLPAKLSTSAVAAALTSCSSEELQKVEINIHPPTDHLGAGRFWEAANEHLVAAEKLKGSNGAGLNQASRQPVGLEAAV